MENGKTPDYVKRAINNYRKDKKQVTLIFSPDQWKQLNENGIMCGADIKRFLLDNIK